MQQVIALDVDVTFPEKLQVLFHPARYKVLYGGRGAGRSWGVARALLLLGTRRPLRVLCAREFQNSIADSVHKLLKDQIQRLCLGGFYEAQQSVIRGRQAGWAPDVYSEFAFEGLRHNTSRIKSYEGIDVCWVEEAEKVSAVSWNDLTPTIRKPDGGPFGQGAEIWIVFNPKLRTDETFQRFVVNAPAGAVVVKSTWRDNPWFPQNLRDDMEADKKRSIDLYNHVWEGECLEVLDGAVYAEELREAQSQGRICKVPYDRATAVHTYWDIGRSDNTSVWFVQQAGFEWHVVDFYSSNLKHIDHYFSVLQSRGYVYGLHWFPHDAKAKHIGVKMSLEEQARAKLGNWNVRIVPKLSVLDGINAARTVFPQCYFDSERCAEGLHALRHYQYDTETVLTRDGSAVKVPSGNPRHDWASHTADAFRYFAVASKMPHMRKRPGMRDVLPRLLRRDEPLWQSGPSTGWMGQ